MLNGVPGPLTVSIGVVAAVAASVLVYRDADRHDHYHALSASVAVAIAALVGFAVGNLVGLAVATGYVLLLYLLSYPSTPGVDGEARRRAPDRPDGTPQGDAGENLTGADDVVSVIRVEVAGEETLREMADRFDDVPAGLPEAELRSRLRVAALDTALDGTDGPAAIGDWATAAAEGSVDDWHGESTGEDRPSEGAAAWNAAPSGDERTGEGAAEDREDSDGVQAWSAEAVDDDAAEVTETGNIREWATVGDGGEERGDDADSPAEASEFGWAEVEAEE